MRRALERADRGVQKLGLVQTQPVSWLSTTKIEGAAYSEQV